MKTRLIESYIGWGVRQVCPTRDSFSYL